jgi:hypothetical protein
MTNRGHFRSRMLADLAVGIFVVALVAIVGRHNGNRGLAIPILCILPLAASVAGDLEPSATRVWVHALVIISPALAVVFGAAVTCRGFECGGLVGLVAAALIFAVLLLVLSFAVFYLRRRITPPM